MIRFSGEIISMAEGMSDKRAYFPVIDTPRVDLVRRLTWLYGDAQKRIAHNLSDVLRWQELGRPK